MGAFCSGGIEKKNDGTNMKSRKLEKVPSNSTSEKLKVFDQFNSISKNDIPYEHTDSKASITVGDEDTKKEEDENIKAGDGKNADEEVKSENSEIERIKLHDLDREEDEEEEVVSAEAAEKKQRLRSDPSTDWLTLSDDFIKELGEIHIHNHTDSDIHFADFQNTQEEKVVLNELHELWENLQLIKKRGNSKETWKQAHECMIAMEAKTTVLTSIQQAKVPLLSAIEIQMNRYNVTPKEFLERRKLILDYIGNNLPVRKFNGIGGWRSHCRVSNTHPDNFKCFGRPRGFLETGPDVAVMLAALNIGTADEPYAPLDQRDTAQLIDDVEYVLNHRDHKKLLLGNSHFGACIKVAHDYQDICVKIMEKIKMRQLIDRFNDFGPSEVQHHRYLCRIDSNVESARLPIPYITRFIKIVKKDSSGDYYYAMELGRDILETLEKSKVISFIEYDKQRKRYMRKHRDAIRADPNWTRVNPSPWEREKKLIILQIAFGVFFMHERGCSHNDIKANNAMIGVDDRRAKLMDFGQTNRFSKNEREHMWCRHKDCGAPKVRSPEAHYIKDRRCPLNIPDTSKFSAKKNDVWSLGIAMYRMLLMLEPFRERNNLADTLFLYLTGGTYLTPEHRKKQQDRVTAVVEKRMTKREANVYITKMKDGKVDYELGIFNICRAIKKDADKVARNRSQFITEKAVRLMHRIFVPEADRISAKEFILDPYFDDIREFVLHDIRTWQQARFGMHDNLYKALGIEKPAHPFQPSPSRSLNSSFSIEMQPTDKVTPPPSVKVGVDTNAPVIAADGESSDVGGAKHPRTTSESSIKGLDDSS